MASNWAITIGINHYRYLQPLKYGVSDAESVCQFFYDELRFQQVYHFTDDSPPIAQDYGPDLVSQPTSTALSRFLRTRFEEPFLKTGDNLWFFFAGHGVRYENRDYLMPMDGDRDDLARSAIPLHYVSERLRRSGADNIILLIDACRNEEGRRDGVGFGEEKQQGVITLYSCSPQEAAYEIEEVKGGAFTHVLLESLRLQGEGNCATVERLYQRLRRYVPQLTRRYRRMSQTPYGRIEPLSKNHLILLPRQATLTDVTALKNDALKAEVVRDLKSARHLWIRVLIVSPGDPDAVDGIERLSRGEGVPSSVDPVTSGSSRSAAPFPASRRMPLQYQVQESGGGLLPDLEKINRRQALQFLGFFGGGVSAIVLGSAIVQRVRTSSVPPLTADDFSPVEFATVKVSETGEVERRETLQGNVFKESIGDSVLELMYIPGDTFEMGAPEGVGGDDERPQHEVTLLPFLMGRYAVTQAQWRAVAALPKVNQDLEAEPFSFKGVNRPVERVSWTDAVEFCRRLTRHSGREYRLPSEAEWEYACRAGTETPFYFGETLTAEVANYRANETYGDGLKGEYREETTEVGSFPVNAFGLYDMHGNVWEWCADHWHDSYVDAPSDGGAWVSGGNASRRLLRGGSWYSSPGNCRCAYRAYYMPEIRDDIVGFRVSCSAPRTLA